VVVTDTVVTSENMPNGARITIRPKNKSDLAALQKTTTERTEALHRTGP
jgi:hypothetical protein